MLKVLIACEESQTSCIAFRELGCLAFSCDIQPCSGGHPSWHVMADVFSIINGNCNFITESGDYYYIDKWDLILAHPPCTYLSNVTSPIMFKGGKLNKTRYLKMLAARDFFYRIWNTKCDHLCVENPKPLSIAKLPRPSDVVNPYDFGSKFSKKTYLWLRNLPPIICGPTQPIHKSLTATISSPKKRSKSDTNMYRAIAEQFVNYINFEKICLSD